MHSVENKILTLRAKIIIVKFLLSMSSQAVGDECI